MVQKKKTSAAAGGNVKESDPKEKEHKEIINMIDFPEVLDTGILNAIKPMEWRNCGPSVVHGFTMLLLQQEIFGKNMVHVQALLERFVKKTMNFMKSNESEIMQMKNKVTRDLQTQDRAVEGKIKTLKSGLDQDIAGINATLETSTADIERGMGEVKDKMERVEDTEITMGRVNVLIEETKDLLKSQILEEHQTTVSGFKKIYSDELSAVGHFGIGEKFDNLRDFVINKLVVDDDKADKRLHSLTVAKEKIRKDFTELQREHKNEAGSLYSLTQVVEYHKETINDMKDEKKKYDMQFETRMEINEERLETAVERIDKSGLDHHKKQINDNERELHLCRSALTTRVDETESLTKEVRKEQHINVKDAVDKLRDEHNKRFIDIEMKLKTAGANAAKAGLTGGAGGAKPGNQRAPPREEKSIEKAEGVTPTASPGRKPEAGAAGRRKPPGRGAAADNKDGTPDASPARNPGAKNSGFQGQAEQARRGSDSGATPKGGASPTRVRDSQLSIQTGQSPMNNDDATPREESKSKGSPTPKRSMPARSPTKKGDQSPQSPGIKRDSAMSMHPSDQPPAGNSKCEHKPPLDDEALKKVINQMRQQNMLMKKMVDSNKAEIKESQEKTSEIAIQIQETLLSTTEHKVQIEELYNMMNSFPKGTAGSLPQTSPGLETAETGAYTAQPTTTVTMPAIHLIPQGMPTAQGKQRVGTQPNFSGTDIGSVAEQPNSRENRPIPLGVDFEKKNMKGKPSMDQAFNNSGCKPPSKLKQPVARNK